MTLQGPKARLVGAVALTAAALAGCETYGSATSAPRQFAVVETDTTGATNVNIASLSDVIARNPSDAGAYNTRGAAYARSGQFGDAISDFSKSIQLDPNSASAYNNRALAYRQTGRADTAMQDFSKAIANDPNFSAAYIGRANLERAQGDLDGALNDLNVAIRLAPESAEAYHARGLVRQKQGNNPDAIGDFAAAIDRNPFVAAPYAARGQPDRDEPVRKSDRGLQRGPQRQFEGRRVLGLSRAGLREDEPPQGSHRELPAGGPPRSEQRHGQAGHRPDPGGGGLF